MIALRPARPDDCARVWQWNFASDVRALSGDPRLVELEEHATWYAARLARTQSPMWIVEETGVPVGVVRLDRMSDGAGRISIALSPKARGRGIGKSSITEACARWHGPVVAQVHANNAASRACFEACGFEVVGRAGELIVYERSGFSGPRSTAEGRCGVSIEREAMATSQVALWTSEFGRAYTDRNDRDNPARVTSLGRVLEGIAPANILEVGCNVGWNLTYLRRLGFSNLHGIEPQPYAVERACTREPSADIRIGTAFSLPFPDNSFDLVFTSGVLIHIDPQDLGRALDEIHRVSRRWIAAIEYDNTSEVEIDYRGHAGALWKRDHASVWRLRYPALAKIRSLELHATDGYDDCTAHVFEKAGAWTVVK